MFFVPGGSQKQPKITPESLLALELAPRASWRPLGLDFWILWESQNGPQRGQESKLKFEAFFDGPKRQGQLGPAARGRPQWEGTFGESTYGRRWACSTEPVSVLFTSLRSTAYVEPVRLSGRISSGPAAPNRPLSLRCCAHLSRRGRKGSFGKWFRTVFSIVWWGARKLRKGRLKGSKMSSRAPKMKPK